ncbi:leucine-rich repeat neuronal protein 4 [Centrocercus urophasianus]|uniref:leucine-rich repeat neuronal protein 4 n=1 Tax=Centrocercus urophasianus TaxID=9002 RepID=UPI001C6467CE|nr:leucine-rich repeat neuronal protein 4 [Centrocercus urophasianus]
MLSFLLIICLLARNTASGLVSRAEPAASRDVTTFFQLAQGDHWENVNLTSMSCEDWKNKTWITLQLTNSSLTAFPICLPEALQTLDLSNNLLEEVNGTEIANLPQLRILVLRQNLLQAVRWGSETFSSLHSLDLSFNKLSSVPSCHTSSMPNLRWLSLAGNPLIEIQPLAFSCYPQLQFLNLSTTLLGQEGRRGIQESAFAISLSPGDALHSPKNTISVLDLSGTFLERIQVEWTRDLPNLRFLHLTKMPKLQSLDTDFRSMPHLRELNCRDSHSLGFVRTEMFESTPNLSHLSFQNCNLSSFNSWNTNSSDSIIINLHGNPLLCDCRLSWLLSTPKIVLQKVLDTFCTTSQENGDRPSVSFSLQDLYNKCQAEEDISLPDSNTPSSQGDAFSLASYYTTTAAMTTDSAPLTKDAYIRLNEEASVMSTTSANPAELMLTKANSSSPEDEAVSESMSHPPLLASLTTSPGFLRELYSQTTDYGSVSQTETLKQLQGELRKTHMAFPQERLFSQPTSEHSTPATGKPDAIPHYIHSFAVERTPQTNVRQPNSTKSSTQSASTPTRPRIHYVDDYEYSEETTEPPVQQTYTSCDYNPCRHLQKPCSELQRASPCLCPGMSTENEIPDPPRLREVSEVTDSSAQIHWCAPNSVVRTYQLMLRDQGDEEGQLVLENIYSTARQYTLYNLSPYTTYHVCVTASNSAGLSHTVNQGIAGNSCARFRTKPSYKSVFAALSAASGLFLISTIILSICLCKARKKPHSEQYSTHLVSYKNPAFDYPLKLQSAD